MRSSSGFEMDGASLPAMKSSPLVCQSSMAHALRSNLGVKAQRERKGAKGRKRERKSSAGEREEERKTS